MSCSAEWEKGGARRPELEAAAKQASLSLQHLVPGPTHQDRRQSSSKTSSLLQEGQRKAVRAALLAGVAPNQVAKHFGLSLAAIRKVLEEDCVGRVAERPAWTSQAEHPLPNFVERVGHCGWSAVDSKISFKA